MKTAVRKTGLAELVCYAAGRGLRHMPAPSILALTARTYGLTCADLIGKSRTKCIAEARHVAMFMIRATLEQSYLEIGRVFGHRDHTTVMSAVERVALSLAAGDAEMVDRVRAVVSSDAWKEVAA